MMGLFKKKGKTAEYAAAWYKKGVALGNSERYEEAIKCFDKAIEIDPSYADAWNLKGLVLVNLERYEEAIRYFDKAIEIDPMDADAWYNKGLALSNLGRYEEAVICCDRAIEMKPKFAAAWHCKVLVLAVLGRDEEEIICCDKATEIDPRHADAWYYKGVALANLGRDEEAIICCDKAIEIDPMDANAWANKGGALGNRGRYEEAINCFDKALEIDSRYADAWYYKGVTLINWRRYEEAINCFDKALEINPNFREAKNNKKIAEEKIKELRLSIERTIYDPCKRDFIEGQLPRMKEWINRYDPSAYWFAVSIQNNTDKAIEEWGVDLTMSAALKIEEAKIEGIEIEIPHETHLGLFKISVPKEYGIVIPKGGAQRVYFKLRADKPKTVYEISGIFKSEITGEVPIRQKEFKYLCDTGVSPEAVKAELKKTFSEKDAARLALSFKTVQQIDRMCNQDAKTDEYLDKLSSLKGYTEGFSEKFTKHLEEFSRFMKEEQLGYLDDKYKVKVRRFCTNLVDVWISEFLKG
jgi:tetratricopeptide (TPR) repeat protein